MRKEKIMKKAFVSPKVKILHISTQDIICTSGQGGLQNGSRLYVDPDTEYGDPVEIW